MLIKDIFLKNIERHISGVIKVGQNSLDIIKNEVEEYIITNELQKYFDNFFSHYTDTLDTGTDKMGVWISGFFGSGKSHFLKMLAYTIENTNFGNSNAGEIIREKLKEDAFLYANVKIAYQNPSEVILFNIDSMSDNDSEDSILAVFRRVFYEKLGYLGRIPFIAEIERDLDKKGLYQKFKDIFLENTGNKWEEERDNFGFFEDDIIEALSSCMGVSLESAEKGYRNKEQYHSISISDFASIVREYIDKKNKELDINTFRVLFMVDEVGQFIAQNNSKMLNLQTIVEELGIKCNGLAWVVVTSQEDVESIVGDLSNNARDEYSKILGRFMRFSLSGANTDEVIKKRLLSKNSSSIESLKMLYSHNVNIIKNQFGFTSDSATFHQYKNEIDFIESYPFVPYQFNLLQKVFEAVRKLGASGKHLSHGERSMLNAFQQACIMIKDMEIGYLSPFHLFYDTVEGFMDSHIIYTIKKAADNESLDDFDVSLLKMLFLIRYIEQIKPNLDNIVILMLNKIDEDKQALKSKIEKSLKKLEHEVLISKSGDNFYFLTNEERDIQQEIKNINIYKSSYSDFLFNLIFNEFYPHIKHRYSHYENDYELLRSVDTIARGKGELEIKVFTQFSSDENRDEEMIHKSMGGALVIRLNYSNELENELRQFLRTKEYITKNVGENRTSSFKKILTDLQSENSQREKKIKKILENLISEADYFIFSEKLPGIKNRNFKNTIKESLDKIVENKYNKMSLITHHSIKSQNEIKNALKGENLIGEDIESLLSNESAISEVLSFIENTKLLNGIVTLKDCYTYFSDKPYGWKILDIQFIIANLIYTKKLNIFYENEKQAPIFSARLFDLITKSLYQTKVILELPSEIKREDVKEAKKLFQEITGKIPEDNLGDFVKQLKKFISETIGELNNRLKDLPSNFKVKSFAEIYIDDIITIAKKTEDSDVISEFLIQKDDIQEKLEYLSLTENFLESQYSNFQKIINFIGNYKSGISHYNNPNAEKLLESCQSFLSDKKPFSLIFPLCNEIDETEAELKAYLESAKADYLSKLKEMYEDLKTNKEFNEDFSDVKQRINKSRKIEELMADYLSISQRYERIKKDMSSLKESSVGYDVKQISLSSIIKPIIIKTEADIEIFVEDLKKRLSKELQENNEIEIG